MQGTGDAYAERSSGHRAWSLQSMVGKQEMRVVMESNIFNSLTWRQSSVVATVHAKQL